MAARALRGIVSVTLLAATFASGLGAGQAASAPPGLVAAPGPIVTTGPLTKVETTTDLNCAVNHLADEQGEFFSDTACGTFLVVDGEMFSPASVPAGQPGTPWTPVSQTDVAGTGSAADPFRYTTTVSAGSTGVTVAQTDSYVLGQESYRTDVTVTNSGAARSVRLYRAADCFLADSDNGKGSVTAANGAVACVSTASNRVEQFLPLSPGSHYFEAQYNEVWSQITDKLAFPDTCRCDEEIDNGAGLQWDVSLAAGGSATRSSLITFSPNGSVPLETAKTVDDASVTPGANVTYTITVSNPGTTSASLSTITDDLPAGFSYVPGSTTGTTTSEPSLVGGQLRWTVNDTVAASGTSVLTFHATTSSTPGTYPNNAGGTAVDLFVNPTGDTAPVTVAAGSDTTPTGPVTDLVAVPGDTQVELSWVNPTDADFDHVTVVYLAGSTPPANPEDGTPVTLGSPTATGVTVTGLVNGQDYTFAVFAYDAAGNPSVPASVTSTPIGAGEVAPVTNLQAAGAGSGSVVLTWTNPSQLDGIVVRYSTTGAPAGPTDGTGVATTGTPETITVGGLTDGTTYYFSVFAKLGTAVSTPESVTWAPYTCPNIAPAMSAPTGLVTGQSWVACSAPDANGTSTLSTVLAKTGADQALMTSGDRAVADPPDEGSGEGRNNGSGSRGAFDVSIYKVDLSVPAGSQCLSFDYVFASDEYPEYVGQSFNDGFLAQLDQHVWSVDANSSITATGNFARIGTDYVSVNSPVFGPSATVTTPPANGTAYDGMSTQLRAQTPVTPGAHSMYLSVFDAGDGILDSAVFLDHLTTSTAACSAGTVVNHPPVAGNDTATTNATTAVTTQVLGNDTDPDGDTLTVSGKTNGAHGTVSCTATTCTYTPTGGYTGDDSYTYTVADGKGGTATGTVSVTVTNRAPNAVDDTATVGTGATVSISVLGNDTDPDGHPLSVTTPAPTAAKGTVACSSSGCSYTANLGESGTDTFTYAISDGHGGTDTATVTVTITTPVQPATISIAVDDTTLVWPQVVTVTGVAKKLNGTVMPGVSLQLWAQPAGGSFAPVGGAHTTNSQGKVSQTHRPQTGTTYQWRHVGGSVTSAGKAVTVAPALRASASRTKLAAGAPLVISGTSSPTRAGAPVVLQQLVSGHWQNLQTSNFATDTAATTGGAAYSFTVTQNASKKYSYRVQVPADSGRIARTSATISVAVYQARITGVKAAGDEYVTIKNTGTVAINLSGWKLKDASATTVTLPSRTLAAGSSVRVHTRRGTNNAGNIYLNKPLMWNTHDTATLFDNRAWQISTLTY